MKIVKRLWVLCAVLAASLVVFLWFGNQSPNLLYAVLALDGLMFALSVPCSVFFVAVFFSAWRVLGINPVSAEGAYLDTVFLCVLGFVQWFWLVRVWSPTEPPLQNLNLYSINRR